METKGRNFIENAADEMVIRDIIEGITVISNLVRPSLEFRNIRIFYIIISYQILHQ